MSPTLKSRTRTLAVGGLAAVAAWLAIGSGHPGSAGQPPAAGGKAAAPAPADRPDDRAAVRKALDTFVAAFQKGDGKAVAAHWTADGEYTEDDGATFRG